MVLKVDNYSAVQLLAGSTGSWRTRHLRVRSSWLRERIRSGEVLIQHEPGITQLADIGTKPLPRQRLEELCERAVPRLVGTEVQTDVTGPIARAFTRMEPQVRVERHVHPGPYLCLPGRSVVHFRHDCWAFRNVDRRKIEARTLCEVCINNGEPQYPLRG